MNYKTQVRDLISQRFEGVPLADVVTFGCAQNENDSEKIRGLLYEVGKCRHSYLQHLRHKGKCRA